MQTLAINMLSRINMGNALIQGLSDAIGFVAGGLLGMIISRSLGWDPFAEGYGAYSMIGIAICGLSGGLGVQIGRKFLVPFLQRHLGGK
jgi:hypothetical protein